MSAPWPATGRGILVTGAGAGIGRAIAERFIANGDTVVGLDVEAEGMASLDLAEARLGSAADPETLRAAIMAVEEKAGQVDILIPSAGYGIRGSILDLSIEGWDELFQLNVRQTFLMAKYGVPVMKKTGGGVIVATASQLGIVTAPGMTAYSASKGGLIQLVRALGYEFAQEGVRVNAVCPGPTETRAIRRAFAAAPDPAAAEATLTGWTAMKRLLKPSEIADAVFFLASPGATGITGEALVVDAGYVLS